MLQETKRKAEASNLAKSEFIANLTHELRTPIAGTIGMLDLTLETTLNPDQRDYLEMARYSITTLSQLINDILDFAKLDVGKLVLQNTPFALPNILEATCLSLALAVKAKGLSLKKEIAPDVPEQLIGDPQRLQQIILKLIGNAIKFTKTGGIFLKIMRSQAPEDLYLMRNDPQKIILHFMIQDTGIGIPLEKLNLIFNAFTQADGSFTRKYGGLGLGLSITQELIKIMGGRIWAQSAPEKGSSFHFTIAFSPANTNEDPPRRAAEDLHHKIR
jgi:signal transduction histidine kinase